MKEKNKSTHIFTRIIQILLSATAVMNIWIWSEMYLLSAISNEIPINIIETIIYGLVILMLGCLLLIEGLSEWIIYLLEKL